MGIREEKSFGIRISRIIISQVIPCDLFNGCAQRQSYAGLRFRRLGAWVPEGSIDPAWKGKDAQDSLQAVCTSFDGCRYVGGLISRKILHIIGVCT